ncbi:hypothetical protein [Porphyrobacter sp. ULC335]|uniref:hypothetical protein n=1 Tax=Porphyrobacter sp. ULC335 TaxID=2854260 RepID=UPI00222015EE|nr:hypothetical protein [Porphyrobacter sp. ULC335]UYV15327.1 glycerophosphoryl diester phosphodiesterase membrane domain-containing protein [Porphyrobacter sp. ULC335]
MDIGRVFATSFAMLRQRFWLLVGMWAVFFAIQLAASIVLGIGMAVLGMAGAAGMGAGIEDPGAIAGLGVGMIVFMVLFYGAYLVIVLAQQAAMVTIASPLEEPSFSAAMTRGFKSALPFFGIAVLMMLGYLALVALMAGVLGAASVGGGTAGSAAAVVVALAFLPLLIFFACRFSVLIPVVAVDQVFNPVAAMRRSWSVTRGKVLRIMLAFLGFFGITLLALGVPFALLFGAIFAGQDNPAAVAGIAIIGVLAIIPLFIIYMMFTSTFTAALHSEVTGGGAETLEEVFA